MVYTGGVKQTVKRILLRMGWPARLAALSAVALGSVLWLGGCRPPGAAAPGPVAAAPCPFALAGEEEGEGYTCGVLAVDQRRGAPEGVRLGIFFARLNAADPVQPPLLFLAGGPGASGVYEVPLLAELLAPLRRSRDLLFFDLRGAGFSQPRIDCRSGGHEGVGPSCMAALRGRGLDPMAFNTTQAAADAAELLAALGYVQADLLGVSYGTRLALEMMRSQPQAVRAAVLDSTVAPEVLTYELQALGDYQARLWPYVDCEQNPRCRGRFGGMAGRFLALLNRLDETPPAVLVGHVPLEAGALYRLNNLVAGRPDQVALLPLIVDELDRGETATYRALLDQELGDAPAAAGAGYAFDRFLPRFETFLQTLSSEQAAALRREVAGLPVEDPGHQALLALLAARRIPADLWQLAARMTPYERQRVLAAYGAPIALYVPHVLGDVKAIFDCQEEIPFVDPDLVRQNQSVIPLPALLPPYDFADGVSASQRRCREMGIGPAPLAFKGPVTATHPVLLLAGTQDTVTPMLWAELAAASLPNARLQRLPGYGHALLYQTGACVAELALQFLAAPGQPVAAPCTAPIDYVLEPPLAVRLTGRMWLLQGWAGEAAAGTPITALFSRGRVVGLDGCGTYAGDFVLTGDRLEIGDPVADNDSCTGTAQELQRAFLAALADARQVTVRGDRMLLGTADGTLLVFVLEPDLPLEGPNWRLVALPAAGEAGFPASLQVAPVTARFDQGRWLGVLGCNLYETAYAREKEQLLLGTLEPAAEVACVFPAGILEQEQRVARLLQGVTRYWIGGRELFLYGDSATPSLVFYADP